VLRAGSRARAGRRVRLPGPVSRVVLDQCCSGDLGYLLLQINVICLLLALIGSTAILKHPAWFGAMPAPIAQTIAQR
jgi:hypothetical protein